MGLVGLNEEVPAKYSPRAWLSGVLLLLLLVLASLSSFAYCGNDLRIPPRSGCYLLPLPGGLCAAPLAPCMAAPLC